MPSSDSKNDALRLNKSLRMLCRANEHLGHACAENQDLYLTDFRALLLIRSAQEEGRSITAGELASNLSLSSGAVTYLVERLSQSGHVQREVDPQDRRKVLLVPTELGIQSVNNFQDPLNETLRQVLQDVAPEKLAATLDVLERVNSAVQAHTVGIRAGGQSN
ncbi:MarR family winged helix-turn-helix transcriptional regulator [Luteococcus sp. Sow4_B9]|uniref:MarR family winged helix-turn-helix transcriptional regulator n=1 Tax=Luteococcus sp. Sow4_B9 TaxID=3438792 RepID=UPI003F97F909